MTRYERSALLAVFFICTLSVPSLSAAEGRGYLEIGGGYKTGDFGTPVRANLYYLAPVLGYIAPRYDLSVTLPYLFLSSGSSGMMDTSNMESGIGDVIMRGGLVLVSEGASGFSLDGSLAVKLPTADETKGLGTGEADYGAFMSVHERIEKFKLTLMGGYIKIGDPPLINYNDIYLYGIGISKAFGRTALSASFEGRRSVVTGADNPQEINLGFFHVLNSDYSFKGNAFFGLNDGGPAFGLTLGLVRWF